MRKIISKCILVGNPNCGKSAVFNLLTGSDSYVGNWSGVTVEKKTGYIKNGDKSIEIIDLPGTYSLSPLSSDEKVTSGYIENGKYDLIINIIDAANLTRSLNLTLYLLELNKPMLIVLNMMDIIKKQGNSIDIESLSKILTVPVIPISAAKNIGISKLKEKLFEQQKKSGFLTISNKPKFIENTVKNTVTQKMLSNTADVNIDKVVLHKRYGIVILLAICILLVFFSFTGAAATLSSYLSDLFSDILPDLLRAKFSTFSVSRQVSSLVCDGIISGIGQVIAFLPQLTVMFFLVSFIEDSGYMARAAMLVDLPLRKIGLNGKSFVSIILGFGCSATAILSTRTIENKKERLLTILIIPYIICSAKIPVILMLSGLFFGTKGIFVLISCYLISVIIAVLVTFFNKKRFTDKEDIGIFILDLPAYKVPIIRNLLMQTWNKIKEFLAKAGTVLFTASILIWFLSSFTPKFIYTEIQNESILAVICKFISPIFRPLGFGNWQSVAALLCGIISKESIISTFTVVFGSSDAIMSIFSPASCLSFVIFVIFYFPCIVTVSNIYKETKSVKFLLSNMALHFTVAWGLSFIAYIFFCLFVH